MTDVLIKRELLERANSLLCSYSSTLTDRAVTRRAISEICAILAAARQPEGEGLEVVAFYWLDTGYENPNSHGPYFGWPNEDALRRVDGGAMPIALCHLSDAQRAIAELRDRLDVMTQCADNYSRMFEESEEECERLRVKLMTIASAEPGRHNIEWAKAMAATGNNEAYAKWREAFDQRDKLAWLLREVRGYTDSPHIVGIIDAALAEVK